jgi:tripartite-type tricarboxylate transporter receptor subunit TctC
MFASGGGLVVKPFLEKGLTFDVMADLVPVFNFAQTPHILVVPQAVPAKDMAEFIAYAKNRTLAYGSAGFGSPPHLSMALFAKVAGLKMLHVPYKGVGGAMPDLLAGRVQAMSMALGSARPYLKDGRLRPLAAGAKQRLRGLPEVPTSAEAGVPGWEMSAWFGLFAPRGTPPEIVRLLNEKLQAVLDEPKTSQRLLEAGADPIGGSSESFAERYRADHRMWGEFIRETGIKTE